jgi:hypothetical protein
VDQLRRRSPELSRERVVNPYEAPYRERMRASGARDVQSGFRLKPLPGGYSQLVSVETDREDLGPGPR